MLCDYTTRLPCEPPQEKGFSRKTSSFSPVGSGTLLTWSLAFADPAFAEAVRHIVVPANEQNLDRLTSEVRAGNGCPA